MVKRRRSYEPGHKPKFLVVIDDNPETDRAVYFASRRAARIQGGLVMLRVVEPGARNQQWLGVADLMRAEAEDAAQEILAHAAARANGIAALTPERVLREGDTVEEILRLIEEDEDISLLILAAGTETEGPGPLVTGLGRQAGNFPIPVALVPGHLSDAEIDALA